MSDQGKGLHLTLAWCLLSQAYETFVSSLVDASKMSNASLMAAVAAYHVVDAVPLEWPELITKAGQTLVSRQGQPLVVHIVNG